MREQRSSLIRIEKVSAFLAGWKAAGGDPPQPQKIFQIMHKESISEDAIETDIKE